MRTANLAIVFTDIKGFTERTGRQTHEENRRMLRLHDALLLPVFRAFDGRVVKTIGDAFLSVFASPTKAVLCGVAIQDRLWEYNRLAAEADRIFVRVAVNVGEVREEKGDVFGEPVNIAARVEGLADAGEVLFTEAVFLAMNKAEVPSEDRGPHALKGIAHPVRVYRVPPAPHRIAPEGQAAPAGSELPFGGLGLARAGKLPSADPEELAREMVPDLLAATSNLITRAGGASTGLLARGRTGGHAAVEGLRGAALSVRARWEALPSKGRRALAGVAALLLLALLALSFRGDAVERAVERGDLRAAHEELKKVPPGPAHSYDEGRIEEARRAFGSAASAYLAALRGGERRALSRLLLLTRSDTCAAREQAARALGEAGDRAAIGALETLRDARFTDEGEDSALSALFGCSSRRAARTALEKLGP